jgi:malonyl CoA-acyl carrier protein transacylase
MDGRGSCHPGPLTTEDIRALWLPEPGTEAQAGETLRRPSLQLPLILIVEIALARLWESWGVRPAALIGHSMGENAAACIAGVMTLEGVIGLVHLRGKLFDTVPAGGMLSVPLSEAALAPYLGDLDIASVNAPELTVVSGPDAGLQGAGRPPAHDGIETTRIAIDIAAHSRMLEPILADFRAHLAGMTLSPPQIPIISNRTGQPLTAARRPARITGWPICAAPSALPKASPQLREKADRVYLEVGPGRALATLAQANGAMGGQPVPASLRHPDDTVSDDRHFIATLGRLWACGAATDWSQLWGDARRRRVPLPTYPFQRVALLSSNPAFPPPCKRPTFCPPGTATWSISAIALPGAQPRPIALSMSKPNWARPSHGWSLPMRRALPAPPCSACARGSSCDYRPCWRRLRPNRRGTYTLAPEHGREGYDALICRSRPARPDAGPHRPFLAGDGCRNLPPRFQLLPPQSGTGVLEPVLPWSGHGRGRAETLATSDRHHLGRGAGAQRGAALSRKGRRLRPGPRDAARIARADGGAAGCGPARGRRAIPAETVNLVLEEMLASPANTVAALRGARRYETRLAPAPLPEAGEVPQGSVWVITGGFGGIGVTVAERLMRDHGAKVALIGRSLPAPGSVRAGAQTAGTAGPGAGPGRRCLQSRRHARALDRVRAELGPIHGVIHAAGTVDDAPLSGQGSRRGRIRCCRPRSTAPNCWAVCCRMAALRIWCCSPPPPPSSRPPGRPITWRPTNT